MESNGKHSLRPPTISSQKDINEFLFLDLYNFLYSFFLKGAFSQSDRNLERTAV